MPLGFEDYRRHDAMGLAALIRAGDVSAAEVAEAAVARAKEVNSKINAIVEPLYDRARVAAKAGLPDGPLTGVPWAMKDLGHPVKGVKLTGGSGAFKDFVPDHDGGSTPRLRAAGLNIVATTTSPEFGLTTTTESRLHGLTRNPWNLDHSAGGSSGGSAALVAAGVLPAAHATDGGGSIRVPASCCGLFGLKVSRGRTPCGDGRTEGWNGLGVSHAVTRSVRDSAALLDATHGAEPGSRYVAPPPDASFLDAASRAPGKLRIALQLRPFSGAAVDPECVAAVQAAAKLCESLGHAVEEAQPDLDGETLGVAMGRVVMAHTAATLAARARALGRELTDEEMEPVTQAFRHLGGELTAGELIAADDAFMTAAIAMAKFQATYDILLSPTCATPPPKLGVVSLDQAPSAYGAAIAAFSPFTAIHNQTGQPAMSVPLHWSAAGLPVGVMFAGRLGAEETLLSLAGQLEQARPWFDRVAPL